MRTLVFPPPIPEKDVPEHVRRAMRAFERVHQQLEAQAAMTRRRRYVICVRNEGYEASLELRKVYKALSNSKAGSHGLVRVIDESGQDYLYPEGMFVSIDLPKEAALAFALAQP